jgi:hypothetical protein
MRDRAVELRSHCGRAKHQHSPQFVVIIRPLSDRRVTRRAFTTHRSDYKCNAIRTAGHRFVISQVETRMAS